MDEGDGRAGETVGRPPVESLPRVDHEDGSPAQKEEKHNNEQHPDHALLSHQVGRGAAAAAHALHRGLPAGDAGMKRQTLLFGRLQVTAVTVTWLNAAGAGLPVCKGG